MSTLKAQVQKPLPVMFFVSGLLLLLLFLLAPQVGSLHNGTILLDWEKQDISISDFILRAESEGIELSSEQVDEIVALYNDGIEFNNDPNDPCQKLKLLGLKKLSKWVNQFKNRRFTVKKVRETLETGTRMTYSHPSGSNFTRIIHPDGSSIIVDFVDCVIWQVAPADFKF